MNRYLIIIKLNNNDEAHIKVSAKNQAEAIKRLETNSEFIKFTEDKEIISLNIERIKEKEENFLKSFNIIKEDDKTYIEHKTYPRFKGEITFNANSDIENVEWFDTNCSELDIATALRKAGDYLKLISK